jgi:hypothetical protein
MRLYTPASTEYTRHIIDERFVGDEVRFQDDDGEPAGYADIVYCALAPDLETADEHDAIRSLINNLIIDGSFPEDGFLVSIDVPDDIVFGAMTDDISTLDIWLEADVANAHRDTLVIYDDDGDVVRPDLVGR